MEFGALFTESCRELKLVGRGLGSECVFRTSLGILEGYVYFPWGTGNPCALSAGLSGESSSSTSLITTFFSHRCTATCASRGGLNTYHQDGKTRKEYGERTDKRFQTLSGQFSLVLSSVEGGRLRVSGWKSLRLISHKQVTGLKEDLCYCFRPTSLQEVSTVRKERNKCI